MKGETAELSKLLQNKREEKTTPRKEVLTKKERGRRLNRKEKAEVSTQNVVAAVQVQVATKPEDNLSEANAQTEVIAAMVRPGVNLSRNAEQRGRPPKELLQEQEDQVLWKLSRLTDTDKTFVLESVAAMLDSILSFKRGGAKEQKEKVPTKKAIAKAAAKAADKKAAEHARTKAVVAHEPEVKEVAAGSAIAAAPVPEESLPKIHEPEVKEVQLTLDLAKGRGEMRGQVQKGKKSPKKAVEKAAGKNAAEEAKEETDEPEPQSAEPKEAEVIVAAVVQVGAVEEVDGLKLAIDTLRLESEENVKVQVKRLWKDFLSCMENFFQMFQDHQQVQYERLKAQVDKMFERLFRLEKATGNEGHNGIRWVDRTDRQSPR